MQAHGKAVNQHNREDKNSLLQFNIFLRARTVLQRSSLQFVVKAAFEGILWKQGALMIAVCCGCHGTGALCFFLLYSVLCCTLKLPQNTLTLYS